MFASASAVAATMASMASSADATRAKAMIAWKRTSGRASESARRRRSPARESPISPRAEIAI